MDIEEIIAHAQALAIRNRLLPDAVALYSRLCRSYSKKFYTPLHDVEKLDPLHVVQSVYEDQLESLDLDDDEDVTKLLERILSIQDPNYEAENEEDLKDFIDEAEAEEEVRLEQKVPLTKALKAKKEAPEVTAQKPKELPKSGGINLSYLSESENEG